MLQQKLSRASSSLMTSPHRSNIDVFLFPYEHKALASCFFLKLFSSFLYFSILRKPSKSSWHHFIPLCEAYIFFIHSYSLVLIHERNDISCAGCNHSCQYNCLTTFQGQTVPICSQSVTKTSFSWIAFNQKREPEVCSMLCGNCNEARRNSKEQNRGRCRALFYTFQFIIQSGHFTRNDPTKDH